MIKNTAPYAALLLRVSLGMAFLAHGSVKVFVFGPTAAAAWFASIGLPAVVAYTTIVLEVFGGIALILGIHAAWVALPLAGLMLCTIIFFHGQNGWLFTNPNGGWEYPAMWTAALIVLFLLGDGAYALRPRRRE